MEVPEFLQSKQNNTLYNLKQTLFGDRKKAFGIIGLLVLLVAIPLTVWIAQRTQIFSPRAVSGPIELVVGEDSCVVSADTNKVSCASFPIRLTSPLGPPPSSSPLPSQLASCTADSQCGTGNRCWNYQNFPGTCRSVDIECSQVTRTACHTVNDVEECVEFPTACHVPPGWTTQSSPSPSSASSRINQYIGSLFNELFSRFITKEVIAQTGTAPGTISDGIVSYWRFDETSGDLAVDSKGISNGTATNTTIVDGRVGKGRNTTSANSFVSAADNPAYHTYTFTVAGWVKPTTFGVGNFESIFSRRNEGTNNSGMTLEYAGYQGLGQGQIQCQVSVMGANNLNNQTAVFGAVTQGNERLIANQWNHVACTYDGVLIRVYINGAMVESAMAPGLVNNSLPTMNIVMGKNPYGNNGLNAVIDEIGVWSWAMTDGDIASLVSGSVPTVPPASPVPSVAASASPSPSPSLAASSSPVASISSSPSVGSSVAPSAFSGTGTLRNGLVARWGFDETDGIAVLDSKGDHDGTAVNAEIVEGKFNKARSVINSNSYITVPDDAEFATGVMSVAGWIKPATFGVGNFESIISRRNNNKNSGMTLEYAGYSELGQGQVQCQIVLASTTIGAVTSAIKLNAGAWNHVACTYDGQSAKVYINGVLGATAAGVGSIKQTSPMYILMGKHIDSSGGINAVLDEMMVWNRSLTGSEITALAAGALPDSPGSSSSPTPLPSGPGTSFYKMAETEAGLIGGTLIPYTAHPTITDFTFSNSNPGVKQIWVEFIGVDNTFRKEHISVELVEPGPTITSLDCSMDISRQNLKLTLNGSRLGSAGGKIVVDGKETQVNSWNASQVTATIDPVGNLETGKLFKVVLTTKEGKVFPEIVCRVDTALISLGARLFCREPGKFDVNGVKATIVDENGNKVNEEITIDIDGIIKGLKTKLQVGKPYTLSIKASGSLRKNADFVAANGTNIITPRDDEAFILPVGDIAPVILPDGKINTPDRAEIVRQWSILGTNTRTADFNRDTKVNSIDWACMRFDFNKEDEVVPARGGPMASGSPTPGSSSIRPVRSSLSPALSPTPQASVNSSASPSPLASGQRSAYFLLEPLEGGTYSNGDEFIVDVNVWSQLVAANLFVSKISFDPEALEVIRIEKGTVLTSWAEEFFNNQLGQISLAAGKPNPGLKTVEGDDPLMARIIFKSKKVGNTTITITPDSRIFSNDNNTNILTTLLSAQIAITN